MSPPPTVDHTRRIAEILKILHGRFPQGKVLAETPVSTSDGVKAMDAAWFSPERARELESGPCLLRAPEICIEVLSPSNSQREMVEKRQLYFDAGAVEVWICDLDGTMTFAPKAEKSRLVPNFPAKV
jgi:Uma2 family endonuclease